MGAGFGLADVGSLIQAGNDTFRTGYGVFQDLRDFYYTQKNLKIARYREDSAIQRRVKDAVKAGINPYDAVGAGAGAGAGPTASFSSHNLPEGLNMGSYLDYKINQERLKQEKEQTKQSEYGTQLAKYAVGDAFRNDFLGRLGFQFNTGAHQDYHLLDNDTFRPFVGWNAEPNQSEYDFFSSKPYIQQLNASLNNYMYHTDMLKKENDWYTTNQILNAINSGTGSVGNLFGSFGKAGSGFRDFSMGYKFKNNEPIIKPQIGFQP